MTLPLHFPILSLLVALPLVGAPLCLLARDERLARTIALLTAALALLAALVALGAFDAALSDFQLLHRLPWIPGLGVDWFVGVDGLSILFLPATTLLFLAALVVSGRALSPAPGVYYACVLLLEGATLGIFCALDTLLFFFFWELTLLPLYCLVGMWGLAGSGPRAATRYFLLMLGGGVPLLLAFLVLASHAGMSFDLPSLLAAPPGRDIQILVFLLFLVGFGVKVPLVPLHTWLPSLALGGPAAVTALVVGMKLGVYGLLRFAIPLAPVAAQDMHWLLAGLGTLGILYGAVATTAQSNLRGVVAYGSISHVGLALLGLASFSAAGLQATVLLLLGFTLATGGSFLLLAGLQRRIGTTDLTALSGVRQRMPRLAGFFLLFGLAGMGMPGTIGFPAEFLIVVTTLQEHSGAALAALFGMIVGAGAFLGPYRSAFFGPLRPGAVAESDDLTPREFAVALVFAVLLIGAGLFPGVLLDVLRVSAEAWANRLSLTTG